MTTIGMTSATEDFFPAWPALSAQFDSERDAKASDERNKPRDRQESAALCESASASCAGRMAMKHDDLDATIELHIYRVTARESTSAATDAAIMQAAHEQARVSRERVHLRVIALAAAVVLVAVGTRVAQRERSAAQAIRTRYASITSPYLLGREADESPFRRATRYLLDYRELEQSSPVNGDGSAERKSKGI